MNDRPRAGPVKVFILLRYVFNRTLDFWLIKMHKDTNDTSVCMWQERLHTIAGLVCLFTYTKSGNQSTCSRRCAFANQTMKCIETITVANDQKNEHNTSSNQNKTQQTKNKNIRARTHLPAIERITNAKCTWGIVRAVGMIFEKSVLK